MSSLRRFLFFAYGFSTGHLLYFCSLHWNDSRLHSMEGRATWIVNVGLAFVLVMVQSLERTKLEDKVETLIKMKVGGDNK